MDKLKIKNYQLKQRINQHTSCIFFSYQNLSSSDWIKIKQLFQGMEDVQITVIQNSFGSKSFKRSDIPPFQGPIFMVSCNEISIASVLNFSEKLKSISCLGGFRELEWLSPLDCKIWSKLTKEVYSPAIPLFFLAFLGVIELYADSK